MAVGCPRATSSAKLGPDRAPVRAAAGRTSATISWGSFPDPRSNPLQAQRRSIGDRSAAIAIADSRSPAVEVATMARSQPEAAAARSGSTRSAAGNAASGR